MITKYVSYEYFKPTFLLFTTTDPYDDDAWAGAYEVGEHPRQSASIDPDLLNQGNPPGRVTPLGG